jgi:hypothetical protein
VQNSTVYSEAEHQKKPKKKKEVSAEILFIFMDRLFRKLILVSTEIMFSELTIAGLSLEIVGAHGHFNFRKILLNLKSLLEVYNKLIIQPI